MHGGGQQLMDEFLRTKYNCTGFISGSTNCQMGGWFRKEINTHGRHEGPEVPHRRLRRPDHAEGRRRAAADRRRRHLSCAREGHDRRGRVGRSLRRREARLREGRQVLLLSRLVGARRDAALHLQPAKWNELPKTYQAALQAAGQESGVLDDRQVRPRQPAGAQASGRLRRRAEAVPAGRDGRLLQGGQRALRRAVGQERVVQENVRPPRRLPRRISTCGGRWPSTPWTAT